MTRPSKISIIGAGYVGLCTGAGLASLGHHVICVDIDQKKIDMINSGTPPIYEKDLEKTLRAAADTGMIGATSDLSYAVKNSDITFIAVGTPSSHGQIDLTYVNEASKSIAKALKAKKSYHVIVMKSTVIPGTTQSVSDIIKNESVGTDFGMCVNPEFLREGTALEDFMKPDRIVIGTDGEKPMKIMEDLYGSFKGVPIVKTDMKTAEMIKYASNAFLATKISFMNEIGNMCKRLGIDAYSVAEGMGYDKRIGKKSLDSGIGFGGSCFRKDAEAILHISGGGMSVLKSALDVNAKQPGKIIEILEKKTGIRGMTVAILGLAFKEGTDDIRDSPSVTILGELLKKGASVKAYDPKASGNMKKIFPEINYTNSASEALHGADACLILTGWEEFKNFSDKDFSSMRNRIIIEGRRVLDREKVKEFEGVCW